MHPQYRAYLQAARYINEGLIRKDALPGGRKRQELMEALLPDLGHPEKSFPAIHVAGTSGKGSVATMIAEILCEHGVRTGLHVTPYLQVATEKLWIDGRYASGDEFAELVDWIRPIAEAWRSPTMPLHGLASVAIFLEHFRRSKIELGVVEVGVGGRHDLTNVLQTQVAVVTRVGLDHLKTLGPTLDDIAHHKAGILKKGCRAVVLEGPGLAAAESEARRWGVPLRCVRPTDWSVWETPEGWKMNFRGRKLRLDEITLASPGPHQAENAALALAALEESELESLDPDKVRRSLARARLPGRGEWLPGEPRVLLDGAHNPDKLAAMIAALPSNPAPRLHVVYGGLEGRSPDAEIRRLARRSTTFVATEPTVYQKPARSCDEILEIVRNTGTKAFALANPKEALDAALARAEPNDLVLVTGSLYLVGEIRALRFPDEDVVVQQSSWF